MATVTNVRYITYHNLTSRQPSRALPVAPLVRFPATVSRCYPMLMRLGQLKQLLLHLNAFLVIFYDGLSGVSSGPSLTGLWNCQKVTQRVMELHKMKLYNHGGILGATFRYSTRSHLSCSFVSPLRAYGHCTGPKISSREPSSSFHIRSSHIISYQLISYIYISYHNIISIIFNLIQRTIPPWIYSPLSAFLRHIVRPIRTCLPSRELLSSRTWRLDWSMSWAMISVDFKEMDHDGPWWTMMDHDGPWWTMDPWETNRYQTTPIPVLRKPCCLRL